MNNRKFLMKVKKSNHETIFGKRVFILVRTPWITDNYATFWEKSSGFYEENNYCFYWYRTKPIHAQYLLKELQKIFDIKTGAKFSTYK